MTGFIDVHAHFLTGSYVAQARAAGHDVPDGMSAWPEWSAAAHLELMDRTGIDTAVLSVSSPGTHFGDDQAARQLAREVNDAGARIVQDHPGRFGLFASLPLPDTDGAVSEIGYAFGTLGADGVIVDTNAHGIYEVPAPDPVVQLRRLVGSGHLLYGSDFCFTPAPGIEKQIASINAAPVPVEGATWQSLTTANARELLPRLTPPSTA